MVSSALSSGDRVASGGAEACCSISESGVVEVSGLGELRGLASRCRVVFVNFYSPLCTYCYLFEPVYSRVAGEMAGKAVFARVNVAYYPELAGFFGVMATPTTIVLVDGRPELMMPGYVEYEDFQALAREILEKLGCMDRGQPA